MPRMRPLVARWAVAVALAAALIATSCSNSSAGADAGGGTLLPKSPTALPTFDYGRYRQLLAELKGKPVVVNIWASWCGPCTVEAPELAKASKEFAGRVQFVGVDIQDQIGPARAFISKYGWTYPNVFDPTADIRDRAGYLGVPVTVIFDSTGKQVFVYAGPVNARLLREHLAGLA